MNVLKQIAGKNNYTYTLDDEIDKLGIKEMNSLFSKIYKAIISLEF